MAKEKKTKAADANVMGVLILTNTQMEQTTIAAQPSKHRIKWLWPLPWNCVISFQKVLIPDLNNSPQSIRWESFNLALFFFFFFFASLIESDCFGAECLDKKWFCSPSLNIWEAYPPIHTFYVKPGQSEDQQTKVHAMDFSVLCFPVWPLPKTITLFFPPLHLPLVSFAP